MAYSLMNLWENAKKVAFSAEDVVPVWTLKSYRTFN